MSAHPTLAQRLGRILERVTRQSGQLTRTPAYGSMLLGRPSESPARRRVRIQTILTSFILAVNVVGFAVVMLLVGVAFPVPSMFGDVPWWLPTVVLPSYAVGSLIFGTWWITTRTAADLRWSIEDRPPSRSDQRKVFLTPWRIASSQLVLWCIGAVLLTALYGRYDTDFIPRLGLGITFCGVLVATGSFLFAEFALRPVAAQALAAGDPPHRLAPGIMGRTMTIWMISSGLPMVGFGLTALFSLILKNLTQRQLEIAILITSAAAVVFGFILMWIQAWLVATPVRVVRAAMKRVEEGDLDAGVVVFDGTELGELQKGFNSMAQGLRERERVRDLFGRHVGREVAAAAEQQLPELGGEERHVAVV